MDLKVFDSDSHKMLLEKLENYGVKKALQFFEASICGRQQIVVLDDQNTLQFSGVFWDQFFSPYSRIICLKNAICNTILYEDVTSFAIPGKMFETFKVGIQRAIKDSVL